MPFLKTDEGSLFSIKEVPFLKGTGILHSRHYRIIGDFAESASEKRHYIITGDVAAALRAAYEPQCNGDVAAALRAAYEEEGSMPVARSRNNRKVKVRTGSKREEMIKSCRIMCRYGRKVRLLYCSADEEQKRSVNHV